MVERLKQDNSKI